ncbi:S-adenosylmethionine decarboxylase [Cetobacterium ceti]|uniref:S-adenosylmethionine decarboxylase proenzyme n=1 Tax=Cetobacterium ceti TaxID=180163 RepID=A0A1T4NIN1_9FUSO|nr:adenosylmethionine decarboxylase [Cetobacterium ceti]SJZ78985.1 S-adenosylmethionine decarboxylase [Cetobacterium ceti]
MKLETLGRHILVEFYNCDEDIMRDPRKIEKYMNEAARIANATIVQSVFHHFNPYGVSGAVIISESHLAIHTWPEYGYAAVDVFTCGDKIDPWIAFDYLETMFKADRSESTEIPRGMVEKIRKFSPRELGTITFKPA